MPLPDGWIPDPSVLRDLVALDTQRPVFAGDIADGSITTDKLAADAVTADKLTLPWQTWTPTWTNVDTTGATVAARYALLDKTVAFNVVLTLGIGSSVSGLIKLSLPVAAGSQTGVADARVRAYAAMYDASGSAVFLGVGHLDGTDLTIRALDVATYVRETATSGTVPFTWALTDQLHVSGVYEAA